MGLQTILGSKFYKTLLSKVSATGNTFNDDEKESELQHKFYNHIGRFHYLINIIEIDILYFLLLVICHQTSFYTGRYNDIS